MVKPYSPLEDEEEEDEKLPFAEDEKLPFTEDEKLPFTEDEKLPFAEDEEPAAPAKLSYYQRLKRDQRLMQRVDTGWAQRLQQGLIDKGIIPRPPPKDEPPKPADKAPAGPKRGWTYDPTTGRRVWGIQTQEPVKEYVAKGRFLPEAPLGGVPFVHLPPLPPLPKEAEPAPVAKEYYTEENLERWNTEAKARKDYALANEKPWYELSFDDYTREYVTLHGRDIRYENYDDLTDEEKATLDGLHEKKRSGEQAHGPQSGRWPLFTERIGEGAYTETETVDYSEPTPPLRMPRGEQLEYEASMGTAFTIPRQIDERARKLPEPTVGPKAPETENGFVNFVKHVGYDFNPLNLPTTIITIIHDFNPYTIFYDMTKRSMKAGEHVDYMESSEVERERGDGLIRDYRDGGVFPADYYVNALQVLEDSHDFATEKEFSKFLRNSTTYRNPGTDKVETTDGYTALVALYGDHKGFKGKPPVEQYNYLLQIWRSTQAIDAIELFRSVANDNTADLFRLLPKSFATHLSAGDNLNEFANKVREQGAAILTLAIEHSITGKAPLPARLMQKLGDPSKPTTYNNKGVIYNFIRHLSTVDKIAWRSYLDDEKTEKMQKLWAAYTGMGNEWDYYKAQAPDRPLMARYIRSGYDMWEAKRRAQYANAENTQKRFRAIERHQRNQNVIQNFGENAWHLVEGVIGLADLGFNIVDVYTSPKTDVLENFDMTSQVMTSLWDGLRWHFGGYSDLSDKFLREPLFFALDFAMMKSGLVKSLRWAGNMTAIRAQALSAKLLQLSETANQSTAILIKDAMKTFYEATSKARRKGQKAPEALHALENTVNAAMKDRGGEFVFEVVHDVIKKDRTLAEEAAAATTASELGLKGVRTAEAALEVKKATLQAADETVISLKKALETEVGEIAVKVSEAAQRNPNVIELTSIITPRPKAVSPAAMTPKAGKAALPDTGAVAREFPLGRPPRERPPVTTEPRGAWSDIVSTPGEAVKRHPLRRPPREKVPVEVVPPAEAVRTRVAPRRERVSERAQEIRKPELAWDPATQRYVSRAPVGGAAALAHAAGSPFTIPPLLQAFRDAAGTFKPGAERLFQNGMTGAMMYRRLQQIAKTADSKNTLKNIHTEFIRSMEANGLNPANLMFAGKPITRGYIRDAELGRVIHIADPMSGSFRQAQKDWWSHSAAQAEFQIAEQGEKVAKVLLGTEMTDYIKYATEAATKSDAIRRVAKLVVKNGIPMTAQKWADISLKFQGMAHALDLWGDLANPVLGWVRIPNYMKNALLHKDGWISRPRLRHWTMQMENRLPTLVVASRREASGFSSEFQLRLASRLRQIPAKDAPTLFEILRMESLNARTNFNVNPKAPRGQRITLREDVKPTPALQRQLHTANKYDDIIDYVVEVTETGKAANAFKFPEKLLDVWFPEVYIQGLPKSVQLTWEMFYSQVKASMKTSPENPIGVFASHKMSAQITGESLRINGRRQIMNKEIEAFKKANPEMKGAVLEHEINKIHDKSIREAHAGTISKERADEIIAQAAEHALDQAPALLAGKIKFNKEAAEGERFVAKNAAVADETKGFNESLKALNEKHDASVTWARDMTERHLSDDFKYTLMTGVSDAMFDFQSLNMYNKWEKAPEVMRNFIKTNDLTPSPKQLDPGVWKTMTQDARLKWIEGYNRDVRQYGHNRRSVEVGPQVDEAYLKNVLDGTVFDHKTIKTYADAKFRGRGGNNFFVAKRKGRFKTYELVGMRNTIVADTEVGRFGKLYGMVETNVAHDLLYSQLLAAKYNTVWGKILRGWKRMQTIYSWPTHATNILSNTFVLGPINGMNPLNPLNWGHFSQAAKEFALGTHGPMYRRFVKAGGDGMVGTINRAEEVQHIERGLSAMYTGVRGKGQLLGESIANTSLALFRSADKTYADKLVRQGRMTKGLARALWEIPGAVYAAEDKFWRFATFIKKVKGGMSDADAAHFALEAFGNYGNLSGLFQAMRSSWIGIPFVAFDASVVPRVIQALQANPMKFSMYAAAWEYMGWVNMERSGFPDPGELMKALDEMGIEGYSPLGRINPALAWYGDEVALTRFQKYIPLLTWFPTKKEWRGMKTNLWSGGLDYLRRTAVSQNPGYTVGYILKTGQDPHYQKRISIEGHPMRWDNLADRLFSTWSPRDLFGMWGHDFTYIGKRQARSGDPEKVAKYKKLIDNLMVKRDGLEASPTDKGSPLLEGQIEKLNNKIEDHKEKMWVAAGKLRFGKSKPEANFYVSLYRYTGAQVMGISQADIDYSFRDFAVRKANILKYAPGSVMMPYNIAKEDLKLMVHWGKFGSPDAKWRLSKLQKVGRTVVRELLTKKVTPEQFLNNWRAIKKLLDDILDPIKAKPTTGPPQIIGQAFERYRTGK